eukprot:s421_g15.t1
MFTNDVWHAEHGQHLRLVLSIMIADPDDDDDDDDDNDDEDESLLQSSMTSLKPFSHGLDLPAGPPEFQPFQFNAAAPNFVPALPPLSGQPAFVQALFQDWDHEAFEWQSEGRSARIATYFVNHRDGYPHRLRGRIVHLYADYSQWIQHIQVAWRDRLDPRQPHEYHLVHPSPPQIEAGIAASVIIVQFSQPQLATVLVSVFEESQTLQLRGRFALTLPETIHAEQIVHGAGFSSHCLGSRPTHHFSVRHQGIWIIGAQETRFRIQGHTTCEGYHVLSALGVGGVQIWIRMRWPTSEGDICIQASQLRILARTVHHKDWWFDFVMMTFGRFDTARACFHQWPRMRDFVFRKPCLESIMENMRLGLTAMGLRHAWISLP